MGSEHRWSRGRPRSVQGLGSDSLWGGPLQLKWFHESRRGEHSSSCTPMGRAKDPPQRIPAIHPTWSWRTAASSSHLHVQTHQTEEKNNNNQKCHFCPGIHHPCGNCTPRCPRTQVTFPRGFLWVSVAPMLLTRHTNHRRSPHVMTPTDAVLLGLGATWNGLHSSEHPSFPEIR